MESRRNYEKDLLRETGEKQLVRTCLAVMGNGAARRRHGNEEYFLAPLQDWKIPGSYRPVVDVIFGQLFGLFSSLEHELRLDTTRPNGVISRAVQTIGIYQTAFRPCD